MFASFTALFFWNPALTFVAFAAGAFAPALWRRNDMLGLLLSAGISLAGIVLGGYSIAAIAGVPNVATLSFVLALCGSIVLWAVGVLLACVAYPEQQRTFSLEESPEGTFCERPPLI